MLRTHLRWPASSNKGLPPPAWELHHPLSRENSLPSVMACFSSSDYTKMILFTIICLSYIRNSTIQQERNGGMYIFFKVFGLHKSINKQPLKPPPSVSAGLSYNLGHWKHKNDMWCDMIAYWFCAERFKLSSLLKDLLIMIQILQTFLAPWASFNFRL